MGEVEVDLAGEPLRLKRTCKRASKRASYLFLQTHLFPYFCAGLIWALRGVGESVARRVALPIGNRLPDSKLLDIGKPTCRSRSAKQTLKCGEID